MADNLELALLRVVSASMLQALIMVRDADNDCRLDGLPTIPPPARARIDKAIEDGLAILGVVKER